MMNLPDPDDKFIRGDLIQMFKIFRDIDSIDKDIMPLASFERTRNQGNELKNRFNKTNIRKFTFTNRIVDDWNLLPKEVKEAPTLNTFKNRLDKVPKAKKVKELFEFYER